jgi:hypothetical protein
MVNQCPVSENLEEVVIHELLHLKLYGLDQMLENLLVGMFGKDVTDARREFAYAQFFELLEATVEDLTKGYYTLGGGAKGLSFGRLDKQVQTEINGRNPNAQTTRSEDGLINERATDTRP